MELYNPAKRLETLYEHAKSVVKTEHEIPALRYYRSGNEMIRMAKVYHAESALEQAYILYQRYLWLMLDQLPSHPGYSKLDPAAKKTIKLQRVDALEKAEKIKEKLKSQYEKEYQIKLAEEKERLRAEAEEQLKREEQQRIQQEQQQHEEEARAQRHKEEAAIAEQQKYAQYQQQIQTRDQQPPASTLEHLTPSAPPPAYAEAILDDRKEPNSSQPLFDRSKKPGHLMQEQMSITSVDSQTGLRTVRIPSNLASMFAMRALHNTQRNIETLGILFASLKNHALTVTHVLIPNQTGKDDSCDMLNEEEIIDFSLEQGDLIQVGWIHTHPQYEAFLSSEDLHIHYNHQLLFPDAIAMVVAPKFDDVGIFQLTPGHGMDFIGKCKGKGFHLHPREPPLFKECDHVELIDGKAEFIDLR